MITIIRFVKKDSIPQFMLEMSSKGGAYENFTIHDKNMVPFKSTTDSFIVTHIAPTAELYRIGYDFASDEVQLQNLQRCVTSGSIVASATQVASFNEPVVQVFEPVFDEYGNVSAVISSTISLTSITSEISAHGFMNDIIAQIYNVDANVTNFLYSNIRQDQIPLSGLSVTNMTEKNHLEVMSLAPFTKNTIVPFADKKWKIVYIPTSTFISKYVTAWKWVFLFAFILISVTIILITVVIVKRVQYSNHMKRLDQKRIAALNEAQSKTQTMMNRISDAYRQLTTTINGNFNFI